MGKFLTAHEVLAAIDSGTAKAASITNDCLARIVARDDAVGAWAYLDPANALSQANALDTVQFRGALHGLPVGIKDVLLTRDMPTAYGSDIYAGYAPQLDAAAVTLLRQAGAVIMGKTETVELASIGRPARTRNPRRLNHTPGGSSSGSAAAVADGHVPIALGTQTGGSIIRPASFCGVWALKPTWGLVSTEGAKAFAPSLDTIGWFARSAGDLNLILDVLAPLPIVEVPPIAGTRIGVWRTAGWTRAGAATRDAMALAIDMLEQSGAKVVEMTMPDYFLDLAAAHLTVMMAEGARSFLPEYRSAPEMLHPRIADMVRTAGNYTITDVRAAHDLASEARAAFDRAASEFDAILAPSTIAEAPAGLASTGDLLFNGLFTLLHVPCVNMPLWTARNGLPVGLTLTGPRYADRMVVAFADRISSLT